VGKIETYTEEDELYVIDEAILYKALKVSKGDRARTKNLLKRSGINISVDQINEAIENSSILKAYFGGDSALIHTDNLDPERALLRLPDGREGEVSEQDMQVAIEAQDNYIAARGLEGVGFSSKDIQEMESMAQFVGHGFRKTVDLTHGVMVSQLWKLRNRLQEIEKMLDSDEEIERIEFYSGKEAGYWVEHKSKRTESEKLELLQEYRQLSDLIQKYANTTNQAAAVRLKAEIASHEASERFSQRPKKRLKRAKQ